MTEELTEMTAEVKPYRDAVATVSGGEWWTAAECADHCGISVKTWHSYVAKEHAPAADRKIGRTPLWKPAKVTAWHAQRPGRGRWGAYRPQR